MVHGRATLRVIGSAPELSEAELVEACRRGERSALDALLRSHAPTLHSFLCRLVGFGPDGDDLLQQTLVLAVRQFPHYRGESAVRSWLLGIAVNVARQHVRTVRRRGAHDPLSLVEEVASPAATPEKTLEGKRQLLRFQHHLAALSDKQRFAYVLHVLEGHPIEQTAELLGVPVMTAKSRVFLARRALLSRLSKDPVLRQELPPQGKIDG